jgi:hypothetical protein
MARSDDQWTFEGFSSPNFTPVPDEFFDFLAPRLNGGEVKLALYMIRRTYGFKKDNDNISLSQMLKGIVCKDGRRLDYGVGISKEPLIRALKTLEQKNVIYRVKQWDGRGACVATNYRLNVKDFTPGLESNQGGKTFQEGPGLESNQGLVNNPTRGLVQKPTTQYTVNNKQLDNSNVNVSKNKKGRSPLHKLNDAQHDTDHIKLITTDILEVLGDEHSKQFYLLVARKVPEQLIRRTLAELKEGEVKSPARVFTSKILEYVDTALEKTNGKEIDQTRKNLAKHYKSN